MASSSAPRDINDLLTGAGVQHPVPPGILGLRHRLPHHYPSNRKRHLPPQETAILTGSIDALRLRLRRS
jgi:hypothetical protein